MSASRNVEMVGERVVKNSIDVDTGRLLLLLYISTCFSKKVTKAWSEAIYTKHQSHTRVY